MKILLVNNRVRGASGIDSVVQSEERALVRRGHSVHLYERDNAELSSVRGTARARQVLATLYSCRSRREIKALAARHAFDVIHYHNLVPLLTGSAYDGARESNAVLIQHLHNYRSFCPAAYAFRRGHFCSDCTRAAFLPCALHGCYRESHAASLMLVMARWLDWLHGRRSGATPDVWIAVSAAIRSRNIEHAGLPADKLETLDNPVSNLAELLEKPLQLNYPPSKQLIFVGALIIAKGAALLVPLAKAMPDFEIAIIGAGEEEPVLRNAAAAAGVSNIRFLGIQKGREKAILWSQAFLTLVPSVWEEAFGLVAAESFSMGIPVLTTGTGGLKDIVRNGQTGLLMDFSRANDTAMRIRELWMDSSTYIRMRQQARSDFEERFTEDVFGARLETIFARLIKRRQPVGARP